MRSAKTWPPMPWKGAEVCSPFRGKPGKALSQGMTRCGAISLSAGALTVLWEMEAGRILTWSVVPDARKRWTNSS